MAASTVVTPAAVSARRNGDWVIGSDSVVSVGGRLFDKPADRGQAAEHLRTFSGQAMRLTSAIALARDGKVDWSHHETASLQVRELSEDFVAGYLDREWPAVSYCVGVFRIEGPGVQLFESIMGDQFTVLGMPLLAVLGVLGAGAPRSSDGGPRAARRLARSDYAIAISGVAGPTVVNIAFPAQISNDYRLTGSATAAMVVWIWRWCSPWFQRRAKALMPNSLAR